MTPEEKEMVLDCIDMEGFDYCFRDYSDFSEVKDKKFHTLRLAYEAAADALEDYLKAEDE